MIIIYVFFRRAKKRITLAITIRFLA